MARRAGARTRVLHRKARARDRVWSSMRILRRFSLPDLVSTAECNRDNIRKYIIALTRAGYLRVAVAKQNGRKGGHQIWALARNTGPAAPRLQTDGRIFDPNLHIVVEVPRG